MHKPMLKPYKKTLLITSLLLLLPILAGLVLWNLLPDTIATHWGADGQPDGWSSKLFAVLGLPLFMVVIHWVCIFATLADPKKQNVLHGKLFYLILWFIPLLSLVCNAAVLCYAMGIDLSIDRIIPALMGVLFIVIGNYLPKCRQSYTVGIKLPWTLADEENWRRTHRLAGPIWVAGGLVCILTAILHLPLLTLIAVVPMVVVPIVYSYILYTKTHK